MKKGLGIFVLLLFILPVAVLAHKPLLMVDDNGDGTIYIETGFSDGSSGAGHTIMLKDVATGKLLSETKIPEDGSLELDMPQAPYIVVFNAGEGHMVEKEGPFSSGNEVTADEPTEEEVSGSAPAPVVNAPAPSPAEPSVQATPVAYQPVQVGPGAGAAYQMMVGSQIFMSVGIFLIFGVLMFLFGQRWERGRSGRH